MWHAFRSELVKLRRLSVIGGGASMTFFTVLVVVVILQRAVKVPTFPPRPDQVTFAKIQAVDGMHFLLNRSAGIIPIIALILIAANVGAEYSQGTLRNLLVREPGRLRLLAGKFLALLLFVTICAAVALALGIACAFALAPAKGITTSAWTTPDGLNNLSAFIGNVFLTMVGFSIFGLFIALLSRSAAAAVGISFAWFGIGEQVLVAAFNELAKYLPGQLLDAVRSEGTTFGQGPSAVTVSYQWALTRSALWCVAALILGAILLRRRDVNS